MALGRWMCRVAGPGFINLTLADAAITGLAPPMVNDLPLRGHDHHQPLDASFDYARHHVAKAPAIRAARILSPASILDYHHSTLSDPLPDIAYRRREGRYQ